MSLFFLTSPVDGLPRIKRLLFYICSLTVILMVLITHATAVLKRDSSFAGAIDGDLKASILALRPLISKQCLKVVLSELATVGVQVVADLHTITVDNAGVKKWQRAYLIDGLTPYELHRRRKELQTKVVDRQGMLMPTNVYDAQYPYQQFMPAIMLLLSAY